MKTKPIWRLLPTDATARLRQLEWVGLAHLKARLLDKRAFPIRLLLKAQTASQALTDLIKFREWVAAWEAFLPADGVE